MGWEQLAAGSLLDAGTIADVIDSAQPNTYVRLSFDLRASPAGWVIEQIRNAITFAGHPEVEVSSGSPEINFTWFHETTPVSRISVDPFTLITIIISALAVIALTVIGWRVLNNIPKSILTNPWIWAGLAIGAVALMLGSAYQKIKS